MSEIAAALGSLLYGIASAMIPVLNAEVYVGAVAAANASASHPAMAWVCTLAMAGGTAIGKGVIFEASRRGSDRYSRRAQAKAPAEPRTRFGAYLNRVGSSLTQWLSHPQLGIVTVFTAAIVGIPPLLAVAVLAGLSRQRLGWFVMAVLLGRFARFAMITWPVLAVASSA